MICMSNYKSFNIIYITKVLNMKNVVNFFFLTLISSTFLLANGTPSHKVLFHTGSFESGMNKASTEGKLLFVEFYADWCTPCKWMDKTTYKDKDVIKMMNHDFVPLKLDIESPEGAYLKDEYTVRMLPTILIFNSNGKIVDRIEKTLSAESMKSLLSFHDIEENKVVVRTNYNNSPARINSNSEEEQIKAIYSNYLDKEKHRTNYKVQIANYTDYTAAFKKVNELNKVFMEPIVVINEYVNNTTHYKVMLGEFRTMEEAEGFRRILKRDFDIEAIIH